MPLSKAKKLAKEAPRARNKSEHWVVVHNPWYPSHNHRKPRLDDRDLQNISWWLQIIFGPGKVLGIQHQSNQKRIIVKINLNVNIETKLGQHNWERFLHTTTDYERQENSKIFEYDFVKFGDQSDKNWEEYAPLSRPPPHNFPVMWEYPAPVWCAPVGGWALPIKHPVTGDTQQKQGDPNSLQVHDNQDPKLQLPAFQPQSQTIDPHVHGHRILALHSSPSIPSIPGALAGPRYPSAIVQHSSASLSTLDPQIRFQTPLGAQPIGMSSNFQPYNTPHHLSRPLTFPDGNTNTSKMASTIAIKDEQKFQRELSPIHVPYADQDEKKVKKREVSPLYVPYPKPRDEEDEVKSDQLSFAKETSWCSPTGEMLKTRLVLIQNPFGVKFPHPDDNSLPKVLETWDWLQLVVDGALALYFDCKDGSPHSQNTIVARIHGYVDLKGVLGHHKWGQILEHCPEGQEGEISTILPYLMDPEREGLRRLDAPEVQENYEMFRVPYPPPFALSHGSAVQKRQREDLNGRNKRVKFERHE